MLTAIIYHKSNVRINSELHFSRNDGLYSKFFECLSKIKIKEKNKIN